MASGAHRDATPFPPDGKNPDEQRPDRSAPGVPKPCALCGGSGLRVIIREDGAQFAAECSCQIARKAELRLRRARIPARYAHCELENFETRFHGADGTLTKALTAARHIADSFRVEQDGRGLLLTGGIGVGKTHLAVGLLRALIEQKGAVGLFCDYRELLKEIQHSYNPQVAATELGILRPIFEAEVLVLDELGAVRPTDWVWDTVAHVLNTRYNHQRVTIITTNYPNDPPALATNDAGEHSPRKAAARAAREETLGDRIGERMRSRLQQMCIPVWMQGRDFRQRVSSGFSVGF